VETLIPHERKRTRAFGRLSQREREKERERIGGGRLARGSNICRLP